MFTLLAPSHRLRSPTPPRECYTFLLITLFILAVSHLTCQFFGSSVKPDIGSLSDHCDNFLAETTAKKENARLTAAIRHLDATNLELKKTIDICETLRRDDSLHIRSLERKNACLLQAESSAFTSSKEENARLTAAIRRYDATNLELKKTIEICETLRRNDSLHMTSFKRRNTCLLQAFANKSLLVDFQDDGLLRDLLNETNSLVAKLKKDYASLVGVLHAEIAISREMNRTIELCKAKLSAGHVEPCKPLHAKDENTQEQVNRYLSVILACIFVIVCQYFRNHAMKCAALSDNRLVEDSLRHAKSEISDLQSRNQKFEHALSLDKSAIANLESLKRELDHEIASLKASKSEAESEVNKLKSRVLDAESEILTTQNSKLETEKALEQLKNQAAVIQAERERDEANRRKSELEKAQHEMEQARIRSEILAFARKAWEAAARGRSDEVGQHVQAGEALCGIMKPQLEWELKELKQIQDAMLRIQQRSADPREWSAMDVRDFLQCRFCNSLITCDANGVTFTRDLTMMLAAWSCCSSMQLLQTVIAEVEQMVFEADLMKERFQGFEGRVIKASEVEMEARPFASGGLADVYSAVWSKKGLRVAVKVLKGLSANEGSKDQLKTLVKEMDLTRKVAASEFVVKCHGVMVGTKCGIVMDEEFCSLHDAISNNTLGDMRSKLKMLLDIAKGLRGIHNADVIHGDLKPSNVLMGSDGTMKIADFGSSVMYTTERTKAHQDVADCGNAAGTFQFMAPEVWKGNRSKGGDIWAYGIMMWQVFTESVRIWDNSDQYQIMYKVVTEKSIPKLPSSANDTLKGLYVNCCQYEPERRPKADEVISTLEKMLQGLRDRDEYPWPLAPGEDKYHVKVVELPPGSDEFKAVAQMFNKTCISVVRKVERVQNAEQWNLFREKQCAMQVKNGPIGANLKSLFHGTRSEVVQMINHRSFNRSYCGHNATVYGRGTYFARDASYSAIPTYSPADQHGLRYMYLAEVLVGSFAVGNSQMKEPPEIPGQDTKRYDTTINSLLDPTIFVVYHDAQVYPKYLITFE